MSVLLKKPFLTGLVVFLLTIFWGSLGFTALYKHLPAFMEWTLCLLSPFAFTAGMAQVRMKNICFYLFLCVYVHTHIGGQRTVWQMSVLSFHHMGCEDQTRALLPAELSLLSHILFMYTTF